MKFTVEDFKLVPAEDGCELDLKSEAKFIAKHANAILAHWLEKAKTVYQKPITRSWYESSGQTTSLRRAKLVCEEECKP